MGGFNSNQEIIDFLHSPLPTSKSQEKPFVGPPAPKKTLPDFKNNDEIKDFLKSPIHQYDMGPVQKYRQAQEHAAQHPEELSIGSRRAPDAVDKAMERIGDVNVAGDLTLRQAWKNSEAPLGDQGYQQRYDERYQKFLKEHAGAPLMSMASLEALGFGLEHAATGLFSPQNMLLLAGMGAMNPKSILKPLIDAGFSSQMAMGFIQNSRAGVDAFRRGDALSGITAFTDASVSLGFAYLSGKAAVDDVQVRSRAMRMREYAVGKLDELSKSKYNRPWSQLSPHEQAEITYSLATSQNAPLTSATARRMGAQVPSEQREEFYRKAETAAGGLARGTAAAREAVPPTTLPPPPEPPAPLPFEPTEKQPYRPVTGGAELPDNDSMYMTPEERSQRYYTIEEARKRLDEERRIAAQEQETRKTAESEFERIARERREQAEGETAYRETRAGRRLVVQERRGLQFDEATAEANRQEHARLSGEMDRIANEHMYYDAQDMLQSIDTEKARGRELEDWKKNVFALESRRRELLRLSNPEVLEPTRTEAFRGAAEDMALGKRETAMREAAAKIEAEAKKQTDAEEFEKMSAEAEEAKKRAEDIRTERDKKEAERIAATADREEYPLGPVMDMVKGVAGQIILPDGRKVPFHYAVVPQDAVISSHDPFNNFEPNPKAIAVSQGRDYKNNRESQSATIARGKNPEMDLLINTSPTAETGPPIVRSDGQALGGRNRVNIWKLLYKNGFDDLAYQAMTGRARELGVTAEQVANYYTSGRQPMVVRVLDDPFTSAKDLAQLGRDLDRTQTMGFSEAEEAVMAGRGISEKTLDWLSGQLDAMGDDATLRDLMRYRGGEVVERMLDSGMISPTQRAEYITANGEMTEKGKNLFESAVLGKIIDDAELLSTTPKEVLRKLERSVAALARVKAAGGLWDFIPELQDSLRLWKRVDSVRDSLNQIGTAEDSLVDKYLNPGKYKMGTELMKFGEDTVRETPHPTVEALAKLLEQPGKEMKTAVGDYADDAEGKQITLGPPPVPAESFNRHIGSLVKVDVPDDAWGVLRPKEAVSEAKPEEKAPEVQPVVEPQPEATGKSALPDLEGGVTVGGLENVLTQNKNIAPVAKPLLDAMGTVVKNALKMDLGDFLKKYWADIRTEGTPGEAGMEQATGDVSLWARRAGRKLTITPYGEQLDIFGGAEPQFLLRAKGGDERLVLKSELMKIRDEVPRLRELVDSQGNVTQQDLFGAEAENLFGPGKEEEEPPQGTLFQTEDEKLAEVMAKSKSVGANESDWFAKAKAELFPGKTDLAMSEISKVAARAREMRIAAEGPNVLFQEKQGPWIYKSEQVLQGDKLANVQSGAQWAAFLKNKGVKADELKWMGIDEFLEGKKKVSKQELLDFIHENQLQVTEVAHSGTIDQDKLNGYQTARAQAIMELEDQHGYSLDQVPGGYDVAYTNAAGENEWIRLGSGEYSKLPEAVRDKIAEVMGLDEAIRTAGPGRDSTMYSAHTLPGQKKDYTELLFGLPPLPGKDFMMPHFGGDIPNIVAHVRFDERTDAAGNRVLFIEEVQSDWHQKGKKVGYKTEPSEADETARLVAWGKFKDGLRKDDMGGFESLSEAAEDVHGQLSGHPGNEYSPETMEAGREYWRLQDEKLRQMQGVPDAPFKTDWHEMVMKRMLREAAERGYDKIAWVTGEQTADRYDLSKQISRVEWEPSSTPGSAGQGRLKAYNNHGAEVMDRWTEEGKLADFIGKEPAQRLLTQPERTNRVTKEQADAAVMKRIEDGYALTREEDPAFVEKQMEIAKHDPYMFAPWRDFERAAADLKLSARELDELYKNDFSLTARFSKHTLSGVDLKVGGEWAKALYDNAIPNFMRKYGKKWGAGVRDLDIGTAREVVAKWGVRDDGGGGGEVYDLETGRTVMAFDSRQKAMRYAEKNDPNFLSGDNAKSTVHSMDISSEMKKSVMEGQPLFQEKKGATEFLNDGKAVVYLFEKADPSTFLHEFFHTMRRYLDPADQKVLEDWMKIKDGIWSRKDEEQAARAWEYYHRETKPQTLPEKVAVIFKKIQTIMRQIYEQLKGSPLVKPSKEVSALFDRWYGKEMEAPPGEKLTRILADRGSASTSPAKSVVNSAFADTHQLADFLQSAAFKDKGFDGFDVPSQRIVMGDMIAALHDPQVRDAVIEFIPVDVVDGLIGRKDTTNVPLHGENMLGDADIANLKNPISVDIDVANSLASAVAKVVAKLPIRSLEATRGAIENIPAITAIGEHPRTINQTRTSGKADVKTRGEKIPPAAELEAPPLSAAERKDLTLKAQGGILPLDTGTLRTKVFPDFAKAQEWAESNKDKIKGLQIFALKDGRAVSDFTAKKENVLFQTEHEREREKAETATKIAALSSRLQHMLSDAERASINRQIRDLKAKQAAPVVSMEPPPGQVISLWTPEGERPVEVKREQKESRPARTVPDEAIRLEEPPRLGKPAERPRTGGISQPKPAAGGGVRTAGPREAGRTTVGEPRTTLRDVRPLSIAPVPPRDEAAYSVEDWSNRVEKFKLPDNAPAPTVQISDELARMLMPGQREVAESVLSGLKQHNGYILATTTGTGKTYMGSAVISHLLGDKPDARMLILTPSQSLIHGRDGWIQVAGNFGVEVKPLPVGEMPQEPGVYIKTWAGGIANRDIEDVPWDLVIMDEVQEARKWWTSQRGDMSKTMGENAKKILYTSATPFHTALEIGHMGKLGLWGREGFEQWAAVNGLGVYRDKAGNLAGGKAPLRLEKLRQQLIERGQMINIDRNMEGYSAHFGVVPMDGVTSQGLKNIDEALSLAERYFERSGKKGMIQAVKAQRTNLAKRWLEYQRLPQAMELATKLQNEGWKVIFFSENKKEFTELFDFLKPADDAMGGKISQLMPKFRNTTDVLREKFGDDVALFAGKHSAAREAEKDAFNDDSKKHLYATYGAGGVGVSMHDKAGDKPRAVIYLGPPWSGIAFDQALGRPWRYGTKSNVRAYFLFSDSQAEMDLVTNKVAPRMESLRAMVSGVNFEDPVVKNLRAVPDNQVGALDYDHGNAHDAEFDQFTKRRDTSGVSSYAELPIVSSEEAKNKGMQLPGSDGAQDPSVIRLWQDSTEDEVLPQEFEAPELTLGRRVNVELAERFIETGAAPGNAAGRNLKPTERRQIADAIMARAEYAASGDPASATQQVYTEWENGMKQIDAILSGGDEPPLAPPPGEGVPNVPGGSEPPKKEKIGGWKAFEWYAITNGRDVIRGAAKKAGVPEIGDKIARSMAQYHVEAGNISGPWTTRYWDILKENGISPAEHKVLALTLANREKPSPSIDRQLAELRATSPMNERIEKAVQQTQDLFREVFNRMQKDNIYLTVWDAVSGKPRQIYYNEFSSGKGYWPRKYDFESDHRVRDPQTGVETVFNLRNLTKGEIGASKREQIIRGMMDRYGISRSQVEDFLQAKRRDVPLVGHIERAREVDMPFFRTDPDVVISYLEGAGELLSRKKYFEQDGSKVKGLIAQIPDQKARNITAGIVESLLKRNPMEDESRALLRFAADWSVMKMTFSAIKVLGHPIHGSLMTNVRSFGKALYEGVVDYKEAARRAQIAGSTQEQTKIEMLSEYGINKKGIASTLLKWNGWQSSYKWGRVVADANARVYLTDYAIGKLLKDPKNEVVRRQLREFMQLDDSKIDAAIARRRWTEEDLAWAGKAFSDKVMFTFDPTELPPWWRARVGKEKPAEDALLTSVRVMTLLKGYQFKTHALLKDAIWDEAMKGNFRPLIPFLLLYPAGGFLIHSMTSLATANKKYFQTLMKDESWTPGRSLWRMVNEIAHMIGDTALTAWLDAAVHGKETLSGTIGEEYFTGALMSDTARTISLPIELTHAKSTATKKKVVKRYVQGLNPAVRTVMNVLEPPPGLSSETKVLPHLQQ